MLQHYLSVERLKETLVKETPLLSKDHSADEGKRGPLKVPWPGGKRWAYSSR